MTLASRILSLVTLMLVAGAPSFAQVTTGTPPFGTFDTTSGPDVIDLANLNAHIAIPVLHKAGRGLGFTYDLSYDTSVWYQVTVSNISGDATYWKPVANWGWRGQTESAVGYTSYSQIAATPPTKLHPVP